MSTLLTLLELQPGDGTETPGSGPASGPDGKRAYGGQFVAQSLAAACHTVDADRPPTNMHLQFLRGGEAGDPVGLHGDPGVRRPDRGGAPRRLAPGRTAADDGHRVVRRRAGRPRTRAAASTCPAIPRPLPRTGPAGPAPSMPLDELDIRIADDRSTGEFVRRLWWRATVPLPDDRMVHTLVAAYVTDVYMIDPALQVHGHSMKARSHRSGTTDSSIWFHRPGPGRQWNLLESPLAGRGAWTRSRHRQLDPRRRRHRGHPGAGGPYRRAGTAVELTARCRRSRIRLRSSVAR